TSSNATVSAQRRFVLVLRQFLAATSPSQSHFGMKYPRRSLIRAYHIPRLLVWAALPQLILEVPTPGLGRKHLMWSHLRVLPPTTKCPSHMVQAPSQAPSILILSHSLPTLFFNTNRSALPPLIGPTDLTLGTLSPDTQATVPTVVDTAAAQGSINANAVGVYFEPITSSSQGAGELSYGNHLARATLWRH
ncbi:hypothetical protein H0H93_013370, partial [Arthromyces matolae]